MLAAWFGVALGLGSWAPPVLADDALLPVRCSVRRVYDGDTLRCVGGGWSLMTRLYGIDAPELGQPHGAQSRDWLTTRLSGKQVEVRPLSRDRYGRTVGVVLIDGADVSIEALSAGMAWHYARYAPLADLAAAQQAARAAQAGLWASSSPVEPWRWRAGQH